MEDQQILDSLNLTDIYLKISVSDEEHDIRDENEFLLKLIEKTFKEDFLMIDSLTLIKDINLLNVTFVNLIKNGMSQHNYKRYGSVFIAYCDYFDLDYNRCYLGLHNKLQTLIKKDLIKKLGGIANYTKIKNRISPDSIMTLFDL